MRKFVLTAAVACGLFAAEPVRAVAQGLSPGTPPSYSPYLNLFRQGNSAGFNYYSLVRPQLATNASLQTLQQRINTTQIQANANTTAITQGFETGHLTSFMNYGGFFMNSGGGTLGRPTLNRPPIGTPTPPSRARATGR